jgi:hypothetical protein
MQKFTCTDHPLQNRVLNILDIYDDDTKGIQHLRTQRDDHMANEHQKFLFDRRPSCATSWPLLPVQC